MDLFNFLNRKPSQDKTVLDPEIQKQIQIDEENARKIVSNIDFDVLDSPKPPSFGVAQSSISQGFVPPTPSPTESLGRGNYIPKKSNHLENQGAYRNPISESSLSPGQKKKILEGEVKEVENEFPVDWDTGLKSPIPPMHFPSENPNPRY